MKCPHIDEKYGPIRWRTRTVVHIAAAEPAELFLYFDQRWALCASEHLGQSCFVVVVALELKELNIVWRYFHCS